MALATPRHRTTARGTISLLHLVGFVLAGVVGCSAAATNLSDAGLSLTGGQQASQGGSYGRVVTAPPSSEASSATAVMAYGSIPRSFDDTPAAADEAALATSDPVLVGAGDIARCDRDSDSSTARLIESITGVVFTAGDNAYEDGSGADFSKCYAPTWGAFKDRTLPAIGNHEYHTPGASGYFDYFGRRAGSRGRGWYSTNIGTWHIVVLNSDCTIVGCGTGSRQLSWLKADLAAHPAACTLAIWHHPLFSSGMHGNNVAVRPFWKALSAVRAEIVINGHDHDYERFSLQTPYGVVDQERGIREFVVGTGGAQLGHFVSIKPHSRARTARTHGVLVLTLHAASYNWRFESADGATFTDRGWTHCH